MLTVPIDLCRACGRVRGELSMLCASCLRMATMDVSHISQGHYDFRRDSSVREDRGYEPIASHRYYKEP